MYAARRLGGSELQTTSRYCGLSYPAVSRHVYAIEAALQHNVRLRKQIDNIGGTIDKVKI